LQTKLISSAFVLVASLAGGVAHAHYVWLERDGDGPVRAYYGEWIDDIREKTGGLLDRFKAPRVFLGASNEPLQVKRNENDLEVAAKGPSDVRFVENGIPPRDDKEKGGKTRTIYYAKHGRSETAAKLDLELVPTEPNGKTCSDVFWKAAFQDRAYYDRPTQVGKETDYGRPRSCRSTDAVGGAVRIGSDAL